MPARETNPFVVAGALRREDMIDRDHEAADLLSLAEGGQPFRVVGPRRYGKTSLLSRVLDDAETAGMATALVDLEGVLSLEGIVVRLEAAYERRLKGGLRRTVDRILRAWESASRLGAAASRLACRHRRTCTSRASCRGCSRCPRRSMSAPASAA